MENRKLPNLAEFFRGQNDLKHSMSGFPNDKGQKVMGKRQLKVTKKL